jgi:hypothetical protein
VATNPVFGLFLHVLGGLLLAGVLMALLVPAAGGRIGPATAGAVVLFTVLGALLVWRRGRLKAR